MPRPRDGGAVRRLAGISALGLRRGGAAIRRRRARRVRRRTATAKKQGKKEEGWAISNQFRTIQVYPKDFLFIHD